MLTWPIKSPTVLFKRVELASSLVHMLLYVLLLRLRAIVSGQIP